MLVSWLYALGLAQNISMPANINFILYTNDVEALVERTTTDLSWIFWRLFACIKMFLPFMTSLLQ